MVIVVKEQIVELLKKTLKEIGILGVEPLIETPTDPKHGDYASNIAMAIFSNSNFKIQSSKFKTPLELAQEIVKILNAKYLIHNTDRVEAVTPGFINFWLSRQYLLEHLREIVGKSSLLASPSLTWQGKKIMVEFAHPNTHKLFHIGHLRNITLGEVISRLLESVGVKVIRANYQGDVGLHIAKALWGIKKLGLKRPNGLNEKIKFLASAYVSGNTAYEENPEAKKEVEDLNQRLYGGDLELVKLWKETKQWSLEYFDQIYKRVGTKFDRLYFESEVAEPGKQAVLNHVNGVFRKDEGAIIFPGKEHKLHNRVFINSLGLPTYEAKDVGLAMLQFKEFSPDKIIHVVGPEQKGYFAVLFKALEMIDSRFAGKEYHLAYGLVRLKEGKMSSRTGEVVEGEWLLDEAKARIKDQFKEILEETAEKVAVGAVKYSMLKFSPSSDIAFSFDESISLEGNSGPYLQYAYARTQSVLAKLKSKDAILRAKPEESEILHFVQNDNQMGQNDISSEELSILRLIHRFPEVVEEAAQQFAPNLLCNYLFELAQAFNLFYQKHKILPDVILRAKPEESRSFPVRYSQGQDDNTSNFRLALTASVGQIIKNGLYLLGIEAPQRM